MLVFLGALLHLLPTTTFRIYMPLPYPPHKWQTEPQRGKETHPESRGQCIVEPRHDPVQSDSGNTVTVSGFSNNENPK